jgi:hypothetical protein
MLYPPPPLPAPPPALDVEVGLALLYYRLIQGPSQDRVPGSQN